MRTLSRRWLFLWGVCVPVGCTTDNDPNAIPLGGQVAPPDTGLPPVIGEEPGGGGPIPVADAGAPGTGGSAGGGGAGAGGDARGPYCAEGREETCNDLDDNCDGFVDEGCVCMGPEKSCYPGHPDDLTAPSTQCRAGRQVCQFEIYGPCEDFVLPSAEVCDGLDNDCDGRVDDVGDCDNVPPVAICPPDQSGPPLATYAVEGGYEDPDGDPMASATWRIVTQPGGSTARPMPANALSTEIFADLQGEYVLELEVTDADGGVGRCQTRVNTTGNDALRIEMVWNAGADDDRSDVDLHLLRPNGEWFDDAPDGADCFFANCRLCTAGYELGDAVVERECRAQIAEINANPGNEPAPLLTWYPPADDDDPRLDLDDVEGLGPENINVRTPRNGVYRLGVHYWDAQGFGPSTVTLRVFCGGALAKEFEPVVLQPQALDPGGPDTEFWEVADIVWRDGACQVREFGSRGCRQICSLGTLTVAGSCPEGQEREQACR